MRIALFGAAVVFGTVFAFGEMVVGLVGWGQESSTYKALQARADSVAGWVAKASAEQLDAQQYLAPEDLGRSTEIYTEVLDGEGTILFSTAQADGRPPQPPAGLLRSAGSRSATAYVRPGFYLYARPWSRPELGRRGFIVTGQSWQAGRQALAGLKGFLLVSGLVTVAGGLLASWVVAGRALRPLKVVSATADDIRQTRDFSRRLPGSTGSDEIGKLTMSFNGMLSALQEAYDRLTAALDSQRRFVADASHELRTPLTSIRTNAGLLQRPDLTPADRLEAAGDVAAEAARMSRLVDDLLTLARADAGVRLDRGPLDLARLVEDVDAQFRRSNPGRTLAEKVSPVSVEGSRDALQQLLLILLDNASKHTSTGGQISVHLEHSDGEARLEVADDGTGIPAPDLERVFERFYQADPSRYRGGAGLGLSIARWIAGQHGGRIEAANRKEGGAKLTVTLPALSS